MLLFLKKEDLLQMQVDLKKLKKNLAVKKLKRTRNQRA